MQGKKGNQESRACYLEEWKASYARGLPYLRDQIIQDWPGLIVAPKLSNLTKQLAFGFCENKD